MDHDAPTLAVISRQDGPRKNLLHFLSPPICHLKIVMKRHESPPMRDEALPSARSKPFGCVPVLALKTDSSREDSPVHPAGSNGTPPHGHARSHAHEPVGDRLDRPLRAVHRTSGPSAPLYPSINPIAQVNRQTILTIFAPERHLMGSTWSPRPRPRALRRSHA